MKENKDSGLNSTEKTVGNGVRTFFMDMLRGVPIGAAFIIPGFSGGSVAAILGIYEKMIEAVATLLRNMWKSVIILLPIVIGMMLGVVSLLFPLGGALEAFPLPTVSLFVGLAIGGIPSVTDKIPGKPTRTNLVALIIPFLFAFALSFVPLGNDVDLFALDFGGYIVLMLVGMLGSIALIVPGISGSMLLLILGYYNPVLKLATEHFFVGKDFWLCLLVLGVCGAGIVIGFILISLIMKMLLNKYQRGTYFAIVGFIIGSLPTVYISTMKDAGMLSASLELVWLPTSPLYWIASIVLISIGFVAAYSLVRYTRRVSDKKS